MTQMVMSRGMPHGLPKTPPSLRSGTRHFLIDEDIEVMDTKLKIIEIMQVRTAAEFLLAILLFFHPL